ncbi:hypothetical protein ACGFIV_00885 [Sphaerisporangium sp. NPDC049003]|uniref:hypothetical protein n=1 Tax=Sphaerisporangium sp. NPDC049003 TaxID=3364517 RepID=UPI00372460E6
MSEIIEITDNTVVITERITEVVEVGYTLITSEGGGGGNGHTPQLYSGAAAPTTLHIDGDLYLRTSNGDLYQQQASTWALKGNIRGPQGATGPAGQNGADGMQGPQGNPGPAGADGAPGAPGAQGVPGADGADGADGQDGAPGHTPRLYSGAAVPVTLHTDGDLYLRDTGDLYQQQASAWVMKSNIRGPQGATGPAGADGEQGPQGEPGPAGSGGSLVMSDSGYITTGDVTCGTSFTQLGPDHVVAAAVGDVLQLNIDMMANVSGSDLQLEAATQVSGVDAIYWSDGTATGRWPGGLTSWYIPTGDYTGPRGPGQYVVQAGDVVAGMVTVRLYGRVTSGSRLVFANFVYAFRSWLTNRG